MTHSTSPSPEWYEPPDLIEKEDEPIWPAETLTVTGSVVWWSAPTDTDDGDADLVHGDVGCRDRLGVTRQNDNHVVVA